MCDRAAKERKAEYDRRYRAKNKKKIAARMKKYYVGNKDRIAAYHKKYKDENRDKFAADRKKYLADNKKKIAAYHRKYYIKNKKKIAARMKKFYAENREERKKYMAAYLKKYRAENKEKRRLSKKQKEVLIKLQKGGSMIGALNGRYELFTRTKNLKPFQSRFMIETLNKKTVFALLTLGLIIKDNSFESVMDPFSRDSWYRKKLLFKGFKPIIIK